MDTLIYARSSAQSGDSIEAQHDVCRSWAVEHAQNVVGAFADDGVSGTKEQRPGLSEALTALEERKASGIVIHRLDRLARALHVQEAILGRVWDTGATVFTVDGGEVLKDDPTDPMRTFCRQILGAAAQLERGLVIARMQSGKKRSRAAGFYSGGSVPFGYRLLDNGKLEHVATDLELAHDIRAMRSTGLTLREIAESLNKKKIKTSHGSAWYPMTVSRALRLVETTVDVGEKATS